LTVLGFKLRALLLQTSTLPLEPCLWSGYLQISRLEGTMTLLFMLAVIAGVNGRVPPCPVFFHWDGGHVNFFALTGLKCHSSQSQPPK
jgi:hypothetical protein